MGFGEMTSDAGEFNCNGCEPVAVSLDLHAGKMLNPKLALQAELWIQVQSLDANQYASISQTMFMLAGQYWVHPRVWLKGGLGITSLGYSYDDGFVEESESLDSGTAMMGAVGVELMRSRNFGLDLQLRTGVGVYRDREERVSATTLNIGVNWY